MGRPIVGPPGRILHRPLRRMLRSKEKNHKPRKEQPPPVLRGVGGPIGPLAAGSPAHPPNGDGRVDALLRVVRQHLPEPLQRQLTTSSLKSRVEALVKVGCTAPALAPVLAVRTWTGAGPGAVIAWLGDLADQTPAIGHPDHTEDSRSRTLRARAARAAVLAAAAPIETPARQMARALAGQLRTRRTDNPSGPAVAGPPSPLPATAVVPAAGASLTK